jgi:hypothetical protein
MTAVMLLATNCFKIATHLLQASRMRYHYHQEVRLLEGLLTYGIHVCAENRALLLPWGMHESQTMDLNFDPWPSPEATQMFGAHAGYISISSEKGILHLKAQLLHDNKMSMAGSCDLVPRDPKNLQGAMRIVNWHLDSGVSS